MCQMILRVLVFFYFILFSSSAFSDEIPIIGEVIVAGEGVTDLASCFACGIEPGAVAGCLADRVDDPAPFHTKACECDPSHHLCGPGDDDPLRSGH